MIFSVQDASDIDRFHAKLAQADGGTGLDLVAIEKRVDHAADLHEAEEVVLIEAVEEEVAAAVDAVKPSTTNQLTENMARQKRPNLVLKSTTYHRAAAGRI